MTQEEKQLLLKDLCGRLPYGVKVHAKYIDTGVEVEEIGVLGVLISMIDAADVVVAFTSDDTNCYNYVVIHEVKPYLFPMSSMTEEQKKELCKVGGYEAREEDCGYHTETFYYNLVGHEDVFYPDGDDTDWLNKNHFDYRGLIDKGLAIDATGLNIY